MVRRAQQAQRCCKWSGVPSRCSFRRHLPLLKGLFGVHSHLASHRQGGGSGGQDGRWRGGGGGVRACSPLQLHKRQLQRAR